jgi:hypothetical protein
MFSWFRMTKIATGWQPDWITYTHWLKERKRIIKSRKEKEKEREERKRHNDSIVHRWELSKKDKDKK